MSDRIDDRDGSANGLFASLVERERGAAGSLVPRLPTMFEAAPTGESPESLVEDDVVAPPRRATRGQAPPGADAGPRPERRTPPPVEGDPVRHRHEVVHVEREVLVESHEAGTPKDRTVDGPRSPRPDSSTSEGLVSRPVERWPSPNDAQAFNPPEPRRALRPADGPPLRPVATERAVPAPESPEGQGGRDPRGLPVVATRREVGEPRPEPDRAPPALPRPAEPVVRVSIGRLEIRAVPDPAPPRTRRPQRRTQSLDDYLERRNQGSRS